MNKLTKTLSSIGIVAASVMLMAMPVLAQQQPNPFQVGQNYVGNVGTGAGLSAQATNADLPSMIGRIINIALGFLGILLLGYLLYAGFLWMTAGGDEDKVKDATKIIQNAVIGLIIVLAAFAISNFVLSKLVQISQGA